jgi:hypothetical protein
MTANNANKEKPEGSREQPAAGITNRPLEEEKESQGHVPPRGEAKNGSHAS